MSKYSHFISSKDMVKYCMVVCRYLLLESNSLGMERSEEYRDRMAYWQTVVDRRQE